MKYIITILVSILYVNIVSADCSNTYSIREWKVSTEEYFKPEAKISKDGEEYYAVKELKDTSYSVYVSSIGTRLEFSVDNDGLSALMLTFEDVSSCTSITYKIDGGEVRNAQVYSANDEILGIEEPLPFLLSLLGGNTLTINYSSVWGEPRSTMFSVSGIENALEHIIPFHQKTKRAVQRYMKRHKIKRQYECQSNYKNKSLDYYLR